MSRVQMKRRKKREKGSASVRSLICAFSGLAGIIFLVYAVYEAAVKEQMPRMFGIRSAKIPGHSVSSKVWGILLPAVSLAGYMVMYLVGLYRVL